MIILASILGFCLSWDWLVFAEPIQSAKTAKLPSRVEQVIQEAQKILERGDVSYIYGGHRDGSQSECGLCNICLLKEKPTSKERIKKCPECLKCGMDCSHFTAAVFRRAGLPSRYLTTETMINLHPSELFTKFHLKVIDSWQLKPGDLLVYRGHVVMVERVSDPRRVDIVHATGGKDLRGPGMGIQRERGVYFRDFRGPMLRVLRHKDLLTVWGQKSKVDEKKRFRRIHSP